jgi:hypothetical protein
MRSDGGVDLIKRFGGAVPVDVIVNEVTRLKGTE